jgi:hypothetical protein
VSLGAIFGWVGALDPAYIEHMHGKLRHRGRSVSILTLDGHGFMGVAYTEPLRHIAQDDRRSLVIDGEIHAVFAPNAVTAR